MIMSLRFTFLLSVIVLMTLYVVISAIIELVQGDLSYLTTFLASLGAIGSLVALKQAQAARRLEQHIKDTGRSRNKRRPVVRSVEPQPVAVQPVAVKRMQSPDAAMQQMDQLLDAMNDAVILTDMDGNILRVNDAALQMLGFPLNKLFNQPIRTIIAKEHRIKFRLTDEKRAVETILLNQNGDHIPVSYTTSQIDEEKLPVAGYIISARNISERKVTEQRIRYLARIDPLTKLSNRMQFQHLLQRNISRARKRKRKIVMFYLDIDRFKDINDTYGHTAGDSCLEIFASRLTDLLPEQAIIGRLASDEFAIAVESKGSNADVAAFTKDTADKIHEELSKMLLVQGNEIHVTSSIGIACFPTDSDNVVGLIHNADAALNRAKRVPGNSFEFFDAQMNEEETERLMLKSKLRRSYELDELLVQYQPKFDIATGEVSGAEALVRWDLEERGMILPAEFIPLAEETNLIVEIGEWVFEKVCADIRRWENREVTPGRIAINLSLKQLSHPGMLEHLEKTMKEHRISPDDLELEITESTLMSDPEFSVDRLTKLSEMGLTLSIDDFGTGYSSLSALRQFPISTLKIDKSFVRDMNIHKDGGKIISAIVDMAHSMNMKVVAEGVESELQLKQLKTLRCDQVQGLLFGKPMDSEHYFELLTAGLEEMRTHHSMFGK